MMGVKGEEVWVAEQLALYALVEADVVVVGV